MKNKIHLNSIKLLLVLFSAVFLAAALLPAKAAHANGPAPLFLYQIVLENAPEDAYGVDLLVPKDELENDEIYTDLNRETLEEASLPENCELATYEVDGYVSFGCHYSESPTSGLLFEDNYAGTLMGIYSYDNSFEWLAGRKNEKIAIYDKDGSILMVSDPFTMRGVSARYRGQVSFNCANGELTIGGKVVNRKDNSSSGSRFSLFSCLGTTLSPITTVMAGTLYDPPKQPASGSSPVVIILLGCALCTVVIELIIALLFGIRPVWKVPIVTFISNILMNVAIIFLQKTGVNYWLLVGIFEILVIVIEMLVYFLIYKNISKGKLALFSLAANIASCIAIILIW